MLRNLIAEICSAKDCNIIKSDTPARVFFTFFKLYECYQIAQRTTYRFSLSPSIFSSHKQKFSTRFYNTLSNSESDLKLEK